MTLKEFFDLLGENPFYIVAFFTLVPLTALIGSIIGKGEEEETIWQYFYAVLIYLVAIPGIFAITLSMYLFFFERRSILDTNLYTQILPVISMVVTFFIIKRNIHLDKIPGFGNLSGLIMMIGVVLAFMWLMEKTRIYIFSYMPIQYVFLILIGLLVVFRIGWSKMSQS